jgi:DNA repair protein RecO (recombination protein O)
MNQKTRALLLHQVKYSENSLIVTCYTETHGRQSYLINGVRSPKSKNKGSIFQPLFLLELETQTKTTRDVQRLKDFRLAEVYNSIPFDVVKSTISLFLAELLFKVLRSEDSDVELFEFLYNSISYFDKLSKGISNFHLWFLVNLTGYLGFRPMENNSEIDRYFSPRDGRFTPFKAHHPGAPDFEESEMLSRLFKLKIEELDTFRCDGHHRLRLLEILVDFYAWHFQGIGKINSLAVLTQVFR